MLRLFNPDDPEIPADPALLRAREIIHSAKPPLPRLAARRIARRALKESTDCLDAWAILSSTYEQNKRSIDTCLEAIAIGQRRLRQLIDATLADPDAPGLWQHPEGRPLMHLYSVLADRLDIELKYEQASEIWQQMLRLNPPDNQGIRGRAVSRLMLLGQETEADQVLASYPKDPLLSLELCRFLRVFSHYLQTKGLDLFDPLLPQLLDADPELLNSIQPPESLRQHTAELMARCPLLCLTLLNPRISELPFPDTVTPGHLGEAIDAIQDIDPLLEIQPILRIVLLTLPWPDPDTKLLNEDDLYWFMQLDLPDFNEE